MKNIYKIIQTKLVIIILDYKYHFQYLNIEYKIFLIFLQVLKPLFTYIKTRLKVLKIIFYLILFKYKYISS